jgi:hypothetical protein
MLLGIKINMNDYIHMFSGIRYHSTRCVFKSSKGFNGTTAHYTSVGTGLFRLALEHSPTELTDCFPKELFRTLTFPLQKKEAVAPVSQKQSDSACSPSYLQAKSRTSALLMDACA